MDGYLIVRLPEKSSNIISISEKYLHDAKVFTSSISLLANNLRVTSFPLMKLASKQK